MNLLLSIRGNLERKYGTGVGRIDQALNDLVAAHASSGLNSIVVYADQANSLAPYGVSPVAAVNPSEVKRVIDELDRALAQKQTPLEALLLIGGDDIVPFCRLPNPVQRPEDDPDTEVLTDNPYASVDDEPLVVERAIGRLPDAAESSPDLLVKVLSSASDLHLHPRALSVSFGLSASVWALASQNVYASAPGPRPLELSPPTVEANFQPPWLNATWLSYFNLHGMEKSDAWYGQIGVTYPPAVRPLLVAPADVAGTVFFTEACYGANIVRKATNQAISLTALNGGAACFVGSTKIAYGPASPPATDADLLGIDWVQNLLAHQAFGKAFMLAKQSFFKECSALSLFDETAQKTLLEFVLYGDPTLKV